MRSVTILRKRKERGNVMLETALVFVPLFALMMGLIDFSMPIFLRSTFQSAVRAGGRYAITYQTAGGGQDAAIRQVVQDNALGFLDGPTGAALIFIKYYAPTNLSTEVTGPGSNAPGNVVEVSVLGYTWGWLAPISGNTTSGAEYRMRTPLAINVFSSDRMGSLPGGQITPPAR